MSDWLWLMAEQDLSLLISVYWVCLIVGGGLLVISALSGGDADAGIETDVDAGGDFDVDRADVAMDGDAGAEIDHATEAAAGADAGSLAAWLSVRFVIFFLATFGLIGVAMTYLSDVSRGMTLGVAVVGGLALGQVVHQTMRKIGATSGDSTTRQEDYINKLARVTIAVRPPMRGEVAIPVAQGERFVPARSKRDDAAFEVGDRVGILDYRGGIATIVSKQEFEFLSDKNLGDERPGGER